MSLLLHTHYRLAVTSLRQNRTRSLLTCLGIAIGVASIILIFSLMGSINRLISTQVSATGSDLILVRPATHKSNLDSIVSELTSSNQYLKSNLTLDDVAAIEKLDSVVYATPLAIENATMIGNHTVDSATLVGTTPDIAPLLNLTLENGSMISETFSQNTAVLGHDLCTALFGTDSAVGQTFTILGTKFLVIGTLTQMDDPINFNNIDFDNAALVTTTQLKKLDNFQIQQINVKIKNTSEVASTASDIESILSKNKSGDTNFIVAYGDNITHPAGSLFSIISSMLTLVAGISLLVGGIGIMNIMLVSVAERTHEIGIRKAVGAANTNIFLQFLFEALVLSLVGGLAGLALGYIGAFLISIITPFSPFFSFQIVLAALYISLVVGTIFGLYPAIKAARKNPIDSLRSYQ